jgi:tetratricopeptide (TPR) repeat protein
MTTGAGRNQAEGAKYVKAYDDARAADDHEAMAAAALRLSEMQMFGLPPGRIPAFLHEAYQHAEGRQRVELAIAIARAWGYGYEPARARAFATEAVSSAEAASEPALMAAALDALLIVSWGPDDFAERLRITSRLEDTAAHLSDVEVKMSSYLWRLTTALECLDVPAVRRQLRNLDQLAAETRSPRVQFFAAARRGMHALLVGDVEAAERARSESVAAGNEAGEADAFAIDRTLTAAIARQVADLVTIAHEAEVYEEFGLREGVLSVAAESAQLWLAAGEAERAERVLHQIAGADFSRIQRDVDWLLTMTVLTEVAAGVGNRRLCERAVRLLTPYAGRGISNAGAVIFGGVVDHYLALAHSTLGNADEANRWFAQAVTAYDQVGAVWWANRCQSGRPSTASTGEIVLRPTRGGTWEIGPAGATVSIRDIRGLHYLRLLLAHPGRDISARELSSLAAGQADAAVPHDAGLPVIDGQALAAYRARLAEIEDELDTADRSADPDRSRRLAAERDALLAELRRTTGRGGRTRSAGGTEERARVAVRKAIAAAIGRIADLDSSLARLLADTVTTGTLCRYDPDPGRPATWLLS